MLWANLLSLVRIPLGGLFLVVAHRPYQAVAVIVLAAASDMLDGYVARRTSPPAIRNGRNTGDWLDPLCDKIFIGFVSAALVWVRGTPLGFVALLLLRELLQVIALAIFWAVPGLRGRPYNYRANRLGKLTTVSQFVIALLLLFGQAPRWPFAIATALMGVTSLATYIARIREQPASAR